jgi:hypothetical protein
MIEDGESNNLLTIGLNLLPSCKIAFGLSNMIILENNVFKSKVWFEKAYIIFPFHPTCKGHKMWPSRQLGECENSNLLPLHLQPKTMNTPH